MATPVTLDTIRAAHERIRDAIYHSPCPYSLQLSRLCGCRIYCRLDHLQITGSFKERGGRNKLLLLSPEQRRAGVIAASAGNHALAIATPRARASPIEGVGDRPAEAGAGRGGGTRRRVWLNR